MGPHASLSAWAGAEPDAPVGEPVCTGKPVEAGAPAAVAADDADADAGSAPAPVATGRLRRPLRRLG